ncbi:MAG: hypothetical protein WC551_06150 [Patescibacteria group bacterium]
MKQNGQNKMFPLVDLSTPMQRLVGLALANAEHSWLIPVVVSPDNRLELYGFFRHIVAAHGSSESERVIGNELPSVIELERDDETSLLVLNGEDLPKRHQRTILNYRHNFPVVMIAVRPGSEQITQGTGWLEEFHDACAPLPLSWPTWEERGADHDRIISLIRDRLSMPSGVPVPEFDGMAVDYLKSTPFDGTQSVERAIKGALNRYIQACSAGSLEFRHFTALRAARILLGRKEFPPISVVR